MIHTHNEYYSVQLMYSLIRNFYNLFPSTSQTTSSSLSNYIRNERTNINKRIISNKNSNQNWYLLQTFSIALNLYSPLEVKIETVSEHWTHSWKQKMRMKKKLEKSKEKKNVLIYYKCDHQFLASFVLYCFNPQLHGSTRIQMTHCFFLRFFYFIFFSLFVHSDWKVEWAKSFV